MDNSSSQEFFPRPWLVPNSDADGLAARVRILDNSGQAKFRRFIVIFRNFLTKFGKKRQNLPKNPGLIFSNLLYRILVPLNIIFILNGKGVRSGDERRSDFGRILSREFQFGVSFYFLKKSLKFKIRKIFSLCSIYSNQSISYPYILTSHW